MPTCVTPSWVALMKRAGQIRLQLSIICQHPFRATIANQVGGAIENARLYEETKRKTIELQTLSNVSQTIASNQFLDEILQLIVGMIAETMNSPVCSIMVLDERGCLLYTSDAADE